MTLYTALVSEHQLIAGSFQYLHLELISPNRIKFQAGQYIILTIDPKTGLRRNYSIASRSDMAHAVELLVDVKPQGPGSTYLRNLKIGDRVEFVGPFGNFVVADECLKRPGLAAARPGLNTDNELLFVATGSGISPVRAMILDLLLVKKITLPVRLWWGMRQQEDCFWIEDFDNLEKEYPNFKWDIVLSRPPQNWPLHSGHVTKHVLDYVKKQIPNTEYRVPDNTEYRILNTEWRDKKSHSEFSIQNSVFCCYLCGNRFMIEEVSTKLTELGINTEHIHTEKFF